jgi:hypothetical protein
VANHDDQERKDLDFIAHARTDLPRALAALEEARAEVERLKGETSVEAKLGNFSGMLETSINQEEENDRLRAEVERYGKHDELCARRGGYEYPCDCGRDAALGKTTEEET